MDRSILLPTAPAMDAIGDLLFDLISPLTLLVTPNQRIYLPYLLVALLLALLVWGQMRKRAAKDDSALNIRAFFAYCFPRRIYMHASTWLDLKFFFVNTLARLFLLSPLFALAPATDALTLDLLRGMAGRDTLGLPQAYSAPLFTLAGILAFDAALFVAHWLQHKVPALWEFHKVHHSAAVMTPITVYRMHPVDDVLSGIMIGSFTGVVAGVFSFLFPHGGGIITVNGINLVLFLFYFAGYNLRHSHIPLRYPDWLSRILISPVQHQVHHSNAPRHFDKNMGFIFAIWDRMAGTLYVPGRNESLEFGLARGEEREYRSLVRLYLLPFWKLYGAARRSLSNSW